MKITIELDVFSGRPNPGWVTEKDDAETIDALLQNLPLSKAPLSAEGLGYRGFIVYREKGGRKETIHIYAGRVWINDDRENVMEDKKQAEQWLLQMARQKGYDRLLDELGVK